MNRNDTEDKDIELKGGAMLHRFINSAGIPYSAIYKDVYEILSCERNREEGMIKYWNANYERLYAD